MKMENNTKTENAITKKQFARIHMKIQNKYEEMQKKLEKSRSMDSLSCNCLNNKDEEKCVSVCDLHTVTKEENINHSKKNNVQHITILDSKLKDATHEEIAYNEAFVVRSESISNISEKCDSECESTNDYAFFDKNYFQTSLESLNEVAKEESCESEPFTPPPRSLRSRIKSRLRKRLQEDKGTKTKIKGTKNKVENYILSNTTDYGPIKPLKKTKQATVTIALIEVTGFEPSKLEEKPRVLMFRMRLGTEKNKSKLIKSHKDAVQIQELFNFNLYNDDNILELTLWEKDNMTGRSTIDLSEYEKERTHKLHINMDNEYKNIKIFLLLTISGTTLINTLYGYMDESKMKEKREVQRKKYAWYRLCGQFSNIGFLNVIVYGAKGLSASDCFCVLCLNNQRIQTQTDYKTNDPSWMKIISFTVTDITSVLEVIIYDEKKSEEVGRVAIPLLRIKSGRHWYALKCCNLKERAKGNNARVLLEFNLVWNMIKAAMCVINPRELNYLQQEEKLDRHVFARNLSRAKVVSAWIMKAFQVFKTCFQWECMKLNVTSLALWLLFCYYFKLWMLPLLLLVPFMWFKPEQYTIINWKSKIVNEFRPVNNNEAKENKEQDKNVSLRQKINNFQEIIQSIQNIIGKIANLGESIKNLFNFTVPFVSLLAIFMLIVVAFVMYLIPFNYICMFWGIKKFFNKILRPNRVPNNEIMDLLSRIPDDELLNKYEELSVGDISEDNICE